MADFKDMFYLSTDLCFERISLFIEKQFIVSGIERGGAMN
jgi:hypothetical protein